MPESSHMDHYGYRSQSIRFTAHPTRQFRTAGRTQNVRMQSPHLSDLEGLPVWFFKPVLPKRMRGKPGGRVRGLEPCFDSAVLLLSVYRLCFQVQLD